MSMFDVWLGRRCDCVTDDFEPDQATTGDSNFFLLHLVCSRNRHSPRGQFSLLVLLDFTKDESSYRDLGL